MTSQAVYYISDSCNSFLKPQTNKTATKTATWKTVSLYGKEWRVVAYTMSDQ